jgi:hypothetical protein
MMNIISSINESLSYNNHNKKVSSGKMSFPPGVNGSDVLCGRDKLSHCHVGNKKFRRVIEAFRKQYQQAESREVKAQISSQVIDTIHRNGGRFLKLDESAGIWKEVSTAYAKEKCSHALRSAKDPNRPRVKKPRKTKKYVPTVEENIAFQKALQDQRQIFQSLMSNYSDVDSQEGDCHDDDNDEMSMTSTTYNVDDNEDSMSDYDHGDWDFYQ